MTNENLPLLALISVLLMPLLIGVLVNIPKMRAPKTPGRRRSTTPRTLSPKAAAAAEAATSFLYETHRPQRIALDCTRHGAVPLPYSKTVIVQTGPGYALLGVCREPDCGRSMISGVVNASVAAEFINQGSQPEYPRLVAYRAELASVDTADQMDAAIAEARRGTP